MSIQLDCPLKSQAKYPLYIQRVSRVIKGVTCSAVFAYQGCQCQGYPMIVRIEEGVPNFLPYGSGVKSQKQANGLISSCFNSGNMEGEVVDLITGRGGRAVQII